MQHVHHGVGHIAADSATGGLGLLASTPDQGAIGAVNQIEGRGCHIQATVINRRIGGRHFKHVFLIGPQHHGGVFAYLAGDPKLAGHADYPGITNLFGRSHGGGIDGVGNGLQQRDAAAAAGDAEAPGGPTILVAALAIGNGVFWPQAVLQGGCIGKKFESGTGRTQGLNGPVELTALPIRAAHHGPHQAGSRLHCHQGPFHAA